MTEARRFIQHRIEPIGLSLEIYEAWPLESISDDESGNIYQKIADTGGLVFLRFGPQEQLEAFVKTLTGAFSTLTVLSDQATIFCGHNARRLSLQQDRSAIGIYRRQPNQHLVHEHSPAEQTTISVISFTHQNIPVLVGYRLTAQSFAAYRTVLEHIVNSAREL